MPVTLDQLVAEAHTRTEGAKKSMPLEKLKPMAEKHAVRGFRKSILKAAENGVAIIAELKLASGMLKSNPAADASALYWLGSACAKGAKFDEAQSALTDAAAIPGPYQQPARDLLAKVNSARSKAR